MIECKVVSTSRLRAGPDCYNEDHETRTYWPVYTLALRIDDGAPIELRGWHYVIVDDDGDMEIADNDGCNYGIPRVTEVSSGHYCVNTWEEDIDLVAAPGCDYEIEMAIGNAADSIDYVDPGE